MQTETDIESIISTNNGIIDEKYISEEISYHQNPEEIIDHTCDDNENNFLNTK